MKGLNKIVKSAKQAGGKMEKAYKGARDSIRKATNSKVAQAITLHADKTTAAAAKKVGLGAAHKVAKNAISSEFSGNKKLRKKSKANLLEFARSGTTAKAKKPAAAAAAPNA